MCKFKEIVLIRVFLLIFFIICNSSYALTVDEIIKLKQSGVSDEIIKQMIDQEGKDQTGKSQPGSKTTVTIWNMAKCRNLRFARNDPKYFEFSYTDQGLKNYYSINMKTNWYPIEIKAGEYTIIYYDYYGRESIENKVPFYAKNGDKFDIYFDNFGSFWNSAVTLNIFVNNQKIIRRTLEGSAPYSCD